MRQAVLAGADLETLRAALRETGYAAEPHLEGLGDEAASAWVRSVVDVVCDGVRRGAWGEQALGPWVTREVALPLAARVPRPGRLVHDLVRAGGQVWRHADIARWGRLLRAGVAAWPEGAVPVDDVRRAGVVAAWRAGEVRYRRAALREGATLPPTVARAALDLPPELDPRAVLQDNAARPMAWPGVGRRRIVGCAAVGGHFDRVPQLVGGDGLRWEVRDSSPRLLVADAHGCLVRAAEGALGLPRLSGTPTPGGRWVHHTAGGTRASTSATSYDVVLEPAQATP